VPGNRVDTTNQQVIPATTHLRTFFQYLFWRGATATNLALSIPKAAKRWDARLPRHLSLDGVEAVLASVRGNPGMARATTR
jgi:integrase/recombinase XerD